MKRTALLNSEISYVIAGMGHGDLLVIGDCGLPVPSRIKKIDIALTAGVPGIIETLQTVLTELQLEEAWIADELAASANPVYSKLQQMLASIPMRSLPHERFKQMIAERAKAVIRTGECTPYANIILQSGVTF